MQTFFLHAGDNRPKLTATLYGADGAPLDLSGGTVTVKAYYRNGALKFSGAATGPSGGALGSSGQVEYAWSAGDNTPAGRYRLEFVVTVSGATQTVPNYGEDLWLEIT